MFANRPFRLWNFIPPASQIFRETGMRNINMPARCSPSLDLSACTPCPNLAFQRLYGQEAKADTMTADYNYVKRATTNNNVLLVDVREPDEVKEHGKIPNSINIPLGSVTSVFSSMSEKEFQQIYNKSKPNANSEIIFYCMIGKRSGKAQQDAINLGYKNTRNYLGSWTDWSSQGKQ